MGLDLRKRVPLPLGLLMVCATLLSVAWAMFTPPWQGPDETLHYGYVESIAQRHARPGLEKGRLFSTAQGLSMRSSNADRLTQISNGRPQWSSAVADRYDALPGNDRTDDGGGSPAPGLYNVSRGNPPGFYLVETVPYAAGAVLGGVNTRLYTMRLATIAALLVTILGVWLLIGELFGRDRLLQLTGAASVGLLPMATHVSSSVNPDAALYALWTLAFWLGVRSLKRGLTPRTGLGLLAVVVAALLVKATSVVLVPSVMGVVAFGLWANPRVRARLGVLAASRFRLAVTAVAAILAGTVAALAIGARYSTQLTSQFDGQIVPKQMISYLWQFYLPRLPFMEDIQTVRGIPVYDVWFKDLAGHFAWLQISQPNWLYAAMAVVTIPVAVIGIRALWRSQPRSVSVFVISVVVILIGGLHLTDYRQGVLTGVGFMQGRYLLPVMAVFAMIVAAAWSRLPERRRPAATALMLGCLLALQVVSFSRAAGFWYV